MRVPFGSMLIITFAAVGLTLSACTDTSAIACAVATNSQAGRIEEAGFVAIGGIEQWVTIRGDDSTNPILLHVHGGPGAAFSAFTDEFAPYEADFTLVQWDQRGAGCTFGRYGAATPDVTLDRIVRDGIELAEHLQSRLGDRKIVVLGHSFGSIVATEMVRRAPAYFAVYVGTGQFTSFDETVDAQLTYLREAAQAEGSADLGAELDAIEAQEPQGLEEFFAINRLLSNRLPAADAQWLQRLQARAPEVMGPDELADWQAGRQVSADRLMPDLRRTDLTAGTPRLEVPFIVIQGSDDIYTPTVLALAYFGQVEAPVKELVIVDAAAHFPHLTNTEQFLDALVRLARPHAL